MNLEKVRETLQTELSQVSLDEGEMDKMPLPYRMMLGGRNPLEVVGALLAKMPDEMLTKVVDVATRVVRVVEEE